uniref:hypothetical protein n=1 Tax=Cupriavidus nantongensis TaxID=1796606 RepID=UPI0022473889|nr:hypothetical protein [Cupriavidus nantongensis]
MFLVLFSVQLAIYALHEFSEAGALPFVDNRNRHDMTEPYGPDGIYGVWSSYSSVLAPLAFLGFALLSGRKGSAPPEKG